MPLLTDGYVRRLDGVDCSHHQLDAGPVDLAIVRSIPTDWIAWKATQSTRYVDPTFVWARTRARQNGFRHRLFYHWLSSTTDPVAQAEHYLRTVGHLDEGEGVMLDAEEAGITVGQCITWLETVEAVTGRVASVYSGLFVAGGSIWRHPVVRHGRHGDRPMHLAAYVSVARLIGLLRDTGNLDRPLAAWQYSSNGPVPGVTGRVDMNTIIDRDAYNRACYTPHPPPPSPMLPVWVAATGGPMLRFVGSAANDDGTRWLSNDQVRTPITFEWANYLIVHARVSNTLDNADMLTDAELAGLPLVG